MILQAGREWGQNLVALELCAEVLSSSRRTVLHRKDPYWSSSWRTASCGKDPHCRCSWKTVSCRRDPTLQQLAPQKRSQIQEESLESPYSLGFRRNREQILFSIVFCHYVDTWNTNNTLKLGARPGDKVFQASYPWERNLPQSVRTKEQQNVTNGAISET